MNDIVFLSGSGQAAGRVVDRPRSGAPRSALDFMHQARRNGLNVRVFTWLDEALLFPGDCDAESPAKSQFSPNSNSFAIFSLPASATTMCQ